MEKTTKADLPENWLPGEFITWSEVVYFWNHDYAFVDRNRDKCNKENVPEECRCDMCQKELKKNYVTLYWTGTESSESRWYARPGEGREPSKIGATCIKAFVKAHHLKYGDSHE